jgi:hypothetical protein
MLGLTAGCNPANSFGEAASDDDKLPFAAAPVFTLRGDPKRES